MTTASKLTMLRIALTPVFMAFVLLDFPGHQWLGMAVFIVASVTDGLDGYVARRYNQVTNFGKFVDPLADKMLVTAAIVIFVELGQMPAWCAMLIIAREFAVTGLRLLAVEGGRVIAAAWSGKVKTACSIVMICFMLTPWHATPLGLPQLTLDLLGSAVILVTTLWSGVEYFVKNKDIITH